MHKALHMTYRHGALPALLLIGLALALVLGACQLATPSPTPQPTAEPTAVPVSSSGNAAEEGDDAAPARRSLSGSESAEEVPSGEPVAPTEGVSSGTVSAGSSGSAGGSGTAKAELVVDASARYQWVGQVVLSELRGVELSRHCDAQSWLLAFQSSEVEAKAVNSAGLKIILWGRTSPSDARPTIVVEAAYPPDDPMPSMYVPEFPCAGETYPEPAPAPVEQYSWAGVIVVSDLEGRHLELDRGCDTWVLLPQSDDIARKLEDNVGNKLLIWGNVSNEPSIYMRQAISVSAAYGPDDPMIAMYVPEYPCGGIVEPVKPVEPVSPGWYPYPGPGIDLLPGEIAALGKLVSEGDIFYLDTPSGRILLKGNVWFPQPFMGESEAPSKGGTEESIVCLDYSAYYYEGRITAGAVEGHAVSPSEGATEPASEPVQSDVITVEPETGVAVAGRPYWSGEAMVVGTWFVDGGQLVIAVRYITPWGYYCVYPEPVPMPEPMPVPEPVEDSGVLYGQVRIGPLCPVEPCQDQNPNIYSSRSLVLESSAGDVIYIKLLPDGWFKEMVKAGVYVVSLTDCDFMGCQSALPVKVAITSGEYTELMLDIDTGIR